MNPGAKQERPPLVRCPICWVQYSRRRRRCPNEYTERKFVAAKRVREQASMSGRNVPNWVVCVEDHERHAWLIAAMRQAQGDVR